MGRPPATASSSSSAAAAAAAAPVRGIPPAAAAACLLLMLACLAALPAVSEQHPRSPNATDAHGGLWKGRPEHTPPNRDAPKKETAAKNGFFNASSGSTAEEAWLPVVVASAAGGGGGGVKESQLKPPAVLPVGSSRGRRAGGGGGGGRMAPDAAGSPPGAGTSTISLRYLPREANEEEEKKKEVAWEAPQSSHREGTGPLEAVAEVASFAQPLPGGAWKFLDGKEGPPPPSPGSQEEAGSGEPQAGVSPGEGDLAGGATLPPPVSGATEEASSLAGGGLRNSSVGTDLLPDPLGGEAPAPPVERPGPPQQPRGPPDQDSAQKEEPLELWVDASSRSPAEGPPGRTDLTWLEAVTPPVAPATRTPKPSSDPLASEIIDIDYYDLFDGDGLGGEPGSDATKGRPSSSEDKGMSWSLHDLYDDFTPFDESDFYPTTSFYTDGDDEDLEEPEEEEEEEEEEDEGGGLARDLEDENDYRIPTRATPKIQTVAQEAAEPTSRHRPLVPPLETFAVSGGSGLATPRPRPAEAGRDLSLSGGSGENATECRSGYIRHNTSCKSVCDTFPSYCHNGGQCYLVESLGAFCRCNTQDYIWHKGIRCESIITDFQVMCVAVGSAALVVLLLFMMTVFFAKKLYLLKTENNKLRKTKATRKSEACPPTSAGRYRTPSELHNDNFSLSTIAEGSHPNDDPGAPHKLQDPLKSCLKEEESFNIQNSMSPKLENSKGDPDAADVNCLQNNLT